MPIASMPIAYCLLPTPDSLGALSVGELNSPRVAPLPTPDSPTLTTMEFKSIPAYDQWFSN
ncbi:MULTISPECIES: hypothetical protein [Moorena]|uniref:hypothetical protein n=1 Tax=Moorena TaxID=1155738 RepID=UPI001054B982|nr:MULTISPECIES: hypothetical protein [Moorena]NEQ15414.1 hypothetical protein [Moorena sp. SIO3E2]NEP36311.1 hypothetical protein [Moorena sp. SIO3B2]NEP66275.1 hypothetical protein [Moorena sp. SIO3A5]NEQ08864.1 hypothetical protein [Moorena sp. SIO4E2]NER88012.1 hypothetical protein [Moorena sp. SIO3A2]